MVQRPTFSDSELYCIEDAMKQHKIDVSKYCDDKDVTDEMIDILEKLKHWREQEHNFYKAINTLIKI